jgi:Fe-S-cluster-containing hydrogenase component 2
MLREMIRINEEKCNGCSLCIPNCHEGFLRGKKLAIACPKLDSNKELYIDIIVRLIDESMINAITVMIMEIPCWGRLMLVNMA